MNRTQKILGSAIISLLLIAMTMLPMCGVSLQRINPGMEDMSMVDESNGEYQDDLLSDLETFDDDGGFAEADGFSNSDFSTADNSTSGNENFESKDLVGDDSFANDSQWSDDSWGDDSWSDDSWGDASSNENSTVQNTNQDPFTDDFVMTEANNTQQSNEESWITPELMESLQKEIEDLEKIAEAKNRTADSLRQVKRDTPEEDSQQFASKSNASSQLEDSDFMDTANFDSEFAKTAYKAPKQAYSTVAADGSGTAIEMAYDQARNAMIDRNYTSAISQFRIMLVDNNTGNLADNCQYWIGEAYFAQGQYIKAIVEFERVNAYPSSNKSVDAQLMLGIALMRLGQNEEAEKEFTDIIAMSPDNSAAQKATRYLSEMTRA
ncbi:MAG: tetratricopeptide repeat protein [Deferribacteres bacterium]|nr:tetratricopeptide repeat protein [candidate division KSB1 bacterium]MCB9501414.1 tetratricopeptide repeat protein [Deferribacteres bacterium]